MTAPISAIAIGIPAHNEEATIEACLRAVVDAANRVDVPVSIAVAADCCTDRTAEAAASVLAGARSSLVEGATVETRFRSAGAARNAAIDVALASSTSALDATWIATTDADTIVPPAWLRTHLAWATTGVDGIAGLVAVDWPEGSGTLPARYLESIAALGCSIGHGHVHGANLGLRASAWRAVGGCGPSTVGEDHELWARLRAFGAAVLGVDDLHVTTSGRFIGRVRGGFADYLADLRADGLSAAD